MESGQKIQPRKEPYSKSEMAQLKEKYSKGFYKCISCDSRFDTTEDIMKHRVEKHKYPYSCWDNDLLF